MAPAVANRRSTSSERALCSGLARLGSRASRAGFLLGNGQGAGILHKESATCRVGRPVAVLRRKSRQGRGFPWRRQRLLRDLVTGRVNFKEALERGEQVGMDLSASFYQLMLFAHAYGICRCLFRPGGILPGGD